MLKKLATTGGSSWYWLAVIVLGLCMEAVALFYQYALDYGPCVLCIHVRIWTLGIVLVALVTLLVRRVWSLCAIGHALIAIIAAALLERSWRLLGTERGTILGDCSMESGLPTWLALDQWFPSLFGIWEACGYTPKLLFGVTMAEALLVFSVILLLVSIIFVVTILLNRKAAGRSHTS